MKNIRLLEDEEFTQENSKQITPMKDIMTSEDEESAQPDYVESSFEDKNITNPQNNGGKRSLDLMKTVGELKDKDDPQLYLKIIMY